jgi:exopolyphosphatase / guanosine-5'-triphosphate,3'-diphosphate pyrophosphatase
MRAAVIGIGSNSLRLLVADIQNDRQSAVLRERVGLRVFASLNQKLEIGEDMIHNACEAVLLMKTSAQKAGAETIRLFATSALRDAGNKALFTQALLKRTGLTTDIVSGELEARLSFLGAAGMGSAGMIDIGGGSTEIVIGDQGEPLFSCSLQAGAVRLYRELPIASAADTRAVIDVVNRLLDPYLQSIRKMKTPAQWVGVGGTMTAAATSVQEIDWQSQDNIHGFAAKRTEIRRVMETMADMTPDQRRDLGTVPPDRADIVVHGLAILLACMETLQIESIIISEQTNLDGYLRMITTAE